jgi:chemotaxis protein methyltransferase CheR
MALSVSDELENIEIELLVDAVHKVYGYDFRNYSSASRKRRIKKAAHDLELENISEIIPLIIHDKEKFDIFLKSLSIPVTEMFRDPAFFKVLSEKVFPMLKTFPFYKIWHAGCATGMEVFTLAIMLKEHEMYKRASIYATDFNNVAIKTSKEGIYPLKEMKSFSKQYRSAGGKNSLSDYFHVNYKSAKFDQGLLKNVTFANHNLTCDGSFSEVNLILCRNVLIYFNRELQNRVFQLFYESLPINGFLFLGSKETLDFFPLKHCFEVVDGKAKIWRKIK